VKGFLNVEKNTGLKGRWTVLSEKPLIVADTAHNKNGLEIVMQQVHQQKFDKLFMVFGVVNDKDIDSILPYLPKNAEYFVAKPNVPRGLDATVLKDILTTNGFNAIDFNSIPDALNHAKKQSVCKRHDIYWRKYFCGSGSGLEYFGRSPPFNGRVGLYAHSFCGI